MSLSLRPTLELIIFDENGMPLHEYVVMKSKHLDELKKRFDALVAEDKYWNKKMGRSKAQEAER